MSNSTELSQFDEPIPKFNGDGTVTFTDEAPNADRDPITVPLTAAFPHIISEDVTESLFNSYDSYHIVDMYRLPKGQSVDSAFGSSSCTHVAIVQSDVEPEITIEVAYRLWKTNSRFDGTGPLELRCSVSPYALVKYNGQTRLKFRIGERRGIGKEVHDMATSPTF